MFIASTTRDSVIGKDCCLDLDGIIAICDTTIATAIGSLSRLLPFCTHKLHFNVKFTFKSSLAQRTDRIYYVDLHDSGKICVKYMHLDFMFFDTLIMDIDDT